MVNAKMTQIPISNDLSVFFVDQELAQPVTVNGQTITAILTDFYEPIPIGTAQVEGAEILLICQTADVLGIKHSDPVKVGIENFSVVEVKPSNSGISRIKLVRI